jgi:hypothetical protein
MNENRYEVAEVRVRQQAACTGVDIVLDGLERDIRKLALEVLRKPLETSCNVR